MTGSATGSILSTRENSIDTVIQRPIDTCSFQKDPLICNGIAGQLHNITSVSNNVNSSCKNNRLDSVSSFDTNSTLKNHASDTESSITETSSVQETKRMAYDPTINERINPFDKDKIAASRAATAAPETCSSFSGCTFTTTATLDATGGYNFYISTTTPSSSSVSQLPAAIPSTSSSYSSTSILTSSDKGDDNVKDRYNTQQGIRDQSQTDRIGPLPIAIANPADTSTTSVYSSETKKQEFGRTKRSSSDAELIFGDKGLDFYKPRFNNTDTGENIKHNNGSVTDAELIFGTSAVSGPPSAGIAPSMTFNRYSSYGSRDSSSFNSSVSDSDYIYGKKEERSIFNKSLSVSSEKADVDVAEKLYSIPKPYESPKNTSSFGNSSSGKPCNKYDEDDFDLK